MATSFDTVIIGGGFAGVTAARELTMRGRRALLVEARDRIGGRTQTADHGGHGVEIGGTWVHPLQPNVWAEMQRYGLETVPLPEPGTRNAIAYGGKVRNLSDAEMMEGLEALALVCAPAAEIFPEPYSGKLGPDKTGCLERTARDYISSFKFSPEVTEFVDAMCCTILLGPLNQASCADLLRCFALSGFSVVQMMAALTATKIKTGTRSLIDAIAAQATLTEMRLNAPVLRVTQDGKGVKVELASGETITAPTALVTLPMNVLNSVEFKPALSEIKRAAAAERHAGSGLKAFVDVRGDIGNVSVFAPESEIINAAMTYHRGSETSQVVFFCNDARRLALGDVAATQTALRRLIPGVEVKSIMGWDWTHDPLALGTWCIYRPGQTTRIVPELRRTEGRLFFASADSAVGWRSFIDGAIESGYRGARDIDGYLPKGS